MHKAASILFLLLILTAAHCVFPSSSESARTFITLSTSNQTAYAKISFVNASEFHKRAVPGIEQNYSVLMNASAYDAIDEMKIGIAPVAGALLNFTLDGRPLADSAGNEICNSTPANLNGEANCSFAYFINSSGSAVGIDSQKSCGLLLVKYYGNTSGEVPILPTSQAITACPKDNAALSALGPALSGALSANALYCFPAMLIVGLLIASMYYSGRDPLSLFDLTTPRLPKSRQYRVRGPSLPMMITSMMKKIEIQNRKAVKNIAMAAAKAADMRTQGKSGQERKDARKQARERVKEALKLYYKETEGGAPLSKEAQGEISRLLREIMRGRPEGATGKVAQKWDSIEKLGSEGMVKVVSAGDQLASAISLARGGGSTGYEKWMSGKLSLARKGMVYFDESKGARAIQRIPLVRGVVNLPSKTLDVYTQFRASKISAKRIDSESRRALSYLALTKADKKDPGIRNANLLGRLFQKANQKGFDSFMKKADLTNTKKNDILDRAEEYRIGLSAGANILLDQLFTLGFSQLLVRGNPQARQEMAAMLQGVIDTQKLTTKQKAQLEGIYKSLLSSNSETLNQAFATLTKLSKSSSPKYSEIKDFMARMQRHESEAASIFEKLGKNELTHIEALRQLNFLQSQTGVGKKLSEGIGKFSEIMGKLQEGLIYFNNGEFRALTRKDVEDMRTHLYYVGGSNSVLLKAAKAELEALAGKGALTLNGKSVSSSDLAKMKEADKFALLVENKARLPSFQALNAKVDGQIDTQFGKDVSKLSAKDFDARLAKFKERYLGDKGEALLNEMKGIADRINAGNQGRANETAQERSSRLMAMSIFGEGGPLVFFLNDRLRQLGMASEGGNAYSIKDMNDFDLLMRPNTAGRQHFLGQLIKAIMDDKLGADLKKTYLDTLASEQAKLTQANLGKGIPPESIRRQAEAEAARSVASRAYVDILREGTNFAKAWEARGIGVSELLRPGRDKNGVISILADPFSAKNLRFLERKSGEGEVIEYATLRAEFGKSSHERIIDEALLRARRWDTMASQSGWQGQSGSTWANFVYSDLSKYMNRAKEDRSMLSMFFTQLVNKDSQYYDAKFSESMKGRLKQDSDGKPIFNADAYDALIKRGFTLLDLRRKVGFSLASDRRGGMVVMEYDPTILKACGIEDGIYRKGKIVDLAPLIAKIQSSNYGNKLMNIAIMVQHKTPGGENSWVYGNPRKDAVSSGMMEFTETNRDLRVKVGLALSGTTAEGDYNSSAARFKAFSIADLKYSGKPEGQVAFGAGDTKTRNMMLGAKISAGSALSEFMTSAFETRGKNMRDWYTAQTQARFVVWGFSNELEGMMKAGNKRFTFDATKGFVQAEIGGRATQKDLIERRMEKIQAGGESASFAFGWNYRRGIAAGTLNAIADEETRWYSSKLMLKALDSLYKEKAISSADYSARKAEAQAKLAEYTKSYSEARREFKDFNEIARDWAGTHGSAYGSSRNLTTGWVLSKIFDSGYKQGLGMDFFQVAESSVMRDPRVAIGGGYENTMMVGYQTGQNVYEPPTFWAINSGWERAMHFQISLASTIHKLPNEFISYGSRKGSFYPSYFETDPLYGARWGTQDRMAIFKALINIPTDFHYARMQNLLDSSTLGVAISAYMNTGVDPTKQGIIRKGLHHFFTDSDHVHSPALVRGLVRPLERYAEAEKRLDKMLSDPEMRQKYEEWSTTDDPERKKELWTAYFKPISKIYDSRPLPVREGHSGKGIMEDGSRNRFMELYSAYHDSNYWRPMIPGMIDTAPLTDKMSPFTHIAAEVDRASGGPLSVMQHYYTDEYDQKGEWKGTKDLLSTHTDAYRSVYRNDTTLLFNAIKLQGEMMDYSLANSRTLMLASWGLALARGLAYSKTRDSKARASTADQPHYDYIGSRIDADRVYGGGRFGAGESFGEKFEQLTGYATDSVLVDHSKYKHRRPVALARMGTDLANGFAAYSPWYVNRRKRQAIEEEGRAAIEKRGTE